MRRNLTPAAGFLFLGLWATYCAFGLLLAENFGFLTRENAAISARAILAAHGAPLSMLTLGVPNPPLPYVLAVPFAALHLPFPAIWVSSLMGALLCTWFFVWFRRDVAQAPVLILPLLLLPVLPGVLHSSAAGTPAIAAMAFLVFAVHLAARFALEQQTWNDLRRDGRLPAWSHSAQEQAHAIRFLWASALLLGLASCAQPGLLLALPVFLLATPFLLPPAERRNWPRSLTTALLLYLPILTLHVATASLGGLFTGDFFALMKPQGETTFTAWSPSVASLREPLVGFPLTAPVLLYVVIRLRNAAVALLCGVPFLVPLIETALGGSPDWRTLLTTAPLLATALLFLGFRSNRFSRPELGGLVVASMISACTAWLFFAASPVPEERAIASLITGRASDVTTFRAERELANRLDEGSAILLDARAGAVFVTLKNDAAPFLLSGDRRFHFHLANPHTAPHRVLMSHDDEVTRAWESLTPAKTIAFREVASAGAWRLLAPLHSVPSP